MKSASPIIAFCLLLVLAMSSGPGRAADKPHKADALYPSNGKPCLNVCAEHNLAPVCLGHPTAKGTKDSDFLFVCAGKLKSDMSEEGARGGHINFNGGQCSLSGGTGPIANAGSFCACVTNDTNQIFPCGPRH